MMISSWVLCETGLKTLMKKITSFAMPCHGRCENSSTEPRASASGYKQSRDCKGVTMARRATKPNEDENFRSSSTEPRASASGCFRSRDSNGVFRGANAKLRKLDNDGAKHSGHFSEQPRACPPREAQRLGAKEADWAVPQSLFGSGYAGSV